MFSLDCSRGNGRFCLPPLLLIIWLLGSLVARNAYALSDPETPAQCVQQLVFDPTNGSFLTSDTPFVAQQATFNCYAWQMFIAMNWPVNPDWLTHPELAGEPDAKSLAAQFGVPTTADQPMSVAPVWASYKDANDIFLPGAATPTAWGMQPPEPVGCQTKPSLLSLRVGARKFMTATSESAVNAKHRFHLSSSTLVTASDPTLEATGGWLTDQAGKLVYFERKVGKAEFDYIVNNGLYDAANQLQVAKNQGLSLPAGAHFRSPPTSPIAQEKLGAFELKAAWRILTDKPQLYARYLTTVTWLKHPETGQCTQEVVGLVGLHIIHKTVSQPDFIWTTFEHVDNVPDGGSTPTAGYTFNNPKCTGRDCTPNQRRITCTALGCTDDYPRDEPVQVTREDSVPSTITDLNTVVQQAISAKTAGKSVFQYYKLVNVLWDASPHIPDPEPGANATVPLVYGSFSSDGNNTPVSNTTMETYIQNRSCDFCHRNAKVAGSKSLTSDFSFLFESADSSKVPTLIKRMP